MKTTVLAGLAGSLVIAGAASAQFIGWGANTYLVDANGAQVSDPFDGVYSVLDLYATFESSTIVVNVFNMSVVSSANFVQNDAFGPSWSPNQFVPGIGNPLTDSFVTIGGAPGSLSAPTNTTNFDPSFATTANSVTGGWFNGNPPNQQGATAGAGGFAFATWVGRFVIDAPGGGDGLATLAVSGSMTASFGNAFDSQTFKFAAIPAPGALALLGLAGLAGTRRRRA